MVACPALLLTQQARQLGEVDRPAPPLVLGGKILIFRAACNYSAHRHRKENDHRLRRLQ